MSGAKFVGQPSPAAHQAKAAEPERTAAGCIELTAARLQRRHGRPRLLLAFAKLEAILLGIDGRISIEAALLFRLRSVLDQLINELFRMADSVFTAKGSSYLFLVITLHGPSPDRWEKCLNNRIFHATMFHRNLRCAGTRKRGLPGPGVRSRIEAAASGVQQGAGSVRLILAA